MKKLNVLLAACFVWCTAASAATAERSWLDVTAEGVFTRTATSDAAPDGSLPLPYGYAPPEVLWTHNEVNTIYQTTARFGYGGRYIFAGSHINDCGAQLFSTTGSGNFDWEIEAGTAVFTAAAR
ncbi:MAG TPA: hypothetical protein VMW93_04360, partial [bacterium]|nr:hypothetical protein [bacterium]